MKLHHRALAALLATTATVAAVHFATAQFPGGGGGSGSGGAITAPLGPTTPDVSAVAVVPSATASFTVTAASLPLPTGAATEATLSALNTTASSAIPAGANIIGKVSIDQTTPGTTNAASLAQIGATTVSTGAGATGTGTQRVGVAQDTTTIAGAAPGTAGTASANVVSVQGIASGTNLNTAVASCAACNANGQATMASSTPVALASNQSVGDPCTFQAKSNAAFSSASGTFSIVTGVSAKKIYVCAMILVAPSAVAVSLAEGSSSTCGTSNQAAVIGVATSGTAANGLPLAANTGWTLGNGGGTVAQTATAANYLCVFQSSTAQIAGSVSYVQQ